MKLKPEIIPMDQVAAEMPVLLEKKNEKLLLRNESKTRLATIEKVMTENKAMEEISDQQITESLKVFNDEWAKARDYYPEVRFGILQKIITFVGTAEENNDAPKAEPKK
jgi:hypothetical protein